MLGKDVVRRPRAAEGRPARLGLHPLKLGSSSDVQVGDPAIAIGNPFGLDRTLTTGVVSALQRQIQAPNSFKIDHVIQTDAPINPGNSGGPLLDGAGEVIGINSQIETGGTGAQGNIGIGFAVPIDTAKEVIPQLERSGTIREPFLGMTSETIDQSLAGLNLRDQARRARADRRSRQRAAAGGHPRRHVTATLGGRRSTSAATSSPRSAAMTSSGPTSYAR